MMEEKTCGCCVHAHGDVCEIPLYVDAVFYAGRAVKAGKCCWMWEGKEENDGRFSEGTKLKDEKDLHRNGIRVYLTDSEAECLFGLCREWDETMSVAIRTCVKMVSGMDEGQRTRLFLRSE